MAKSEKRSVAEDASDEEPYPKRTRRSSMRRQNNKEKEQPPSNQIPIGAEEAALLHPTQPSVQEFEEEEESTENETQDHVPPKINPNTPSSKKVDTPKKDSKKMTPAKNQILSPPSIRRSVHFSRKNTIRYIHSTKERHDVHVVVSERKSPSSWYESLQIFLIFGVCCILFVSAVLRSTDSSPLIQKQEVGGHLIPPRSEGEATAQRANFTLRDFLMDPSGIQLAMAPSFFGYYGYFGALAAWEDELSTDTFDILQERIQGTAGASAGAMAAILLAAGVPPRVAAEFCTTITLPQFADFPGLFTIFRGNKFEKIMYDFLKDQKPDASLQLQHASIPVAVSGFDLQTFTTKLLKRGSMARAARASACFPFLFQPVGWIDGSENSLFIDGGILDPAGVMGLAALEDSSAGAAEANTKKRIVNIVVGDFHLGRSLGPSQMPEGVDASQVLSISIQNLPSCGPWAMENGPLAVEGARRAMKASLNSPVYIGKENGHYELHIDASSFIPSND